MKGSQISSQGYSYLKRFRKLEDKSLKSRVIMMPIVKKINTREGSLENRDETPETFD